MRENLEILDKVMEIIFCDTSAVLELEFMQITNILFGEETEIKVGTICF